MRASPGDVTVVTVAADSGEALIRWRDAWAPTGCALLLADNGSTDGFPGKSRIPVVPTGGNVGFGPGINAAAARCETPLILVTNPDTAPASEDSLRILLKSHRKGTLSGGGLLDSRGRPVPSGGRWPTVPWVAGQVFFRASSLWRRGRPDWIQGSLILAETAVFLGELEGFHRDFPLYFEDVDLCAGALSRGIATVFLPGAAFVHVEGTGAPSARAVRISCFHWGMWRWFVRHRPGAAPLVRWLVMRKCLFRMAAAERGSSVRKGYEKALHALRRRIPPELPPTGSLGG
jgi:GT2 family glycosyltransferase